MSGSEGGLGKRTSREADTAPQVDPLVAALEEAGKSVWVDWEDIEKSADWRERIERGIESAKTVIPVLSPDFAHSDVAGEEIALATTHHKRLIPVLRRNVDLRMLGIWSRPELTRARPAFESEAVPA